ISGDKLTKVQNIIDYYEDIAIAETSDPTDDRAKYYECIEELAVRDYKILRGNKIISKDVDIEHFFEEATRYAFEKKLELPLLDMDGSKHADGRLKYNSREVILWDNKST